MIMKRYFIAVCTMLIAMVSCQKNEDKVTEQKSEPIPVKLTVSIGEATKVTFEEEDNVLKTAWEADDQVSIIALDESHNVISNDIFTAQSSGKSTDFTGTFTNDAATRYVRVFYPALTEGEGVADDEWYSSPADPYNGTGPIFNVRKGDDVMDYTVGYQLQKQDADYSHIDDYIVLSGDIDPEEIASDTWDVVLNHRSYVLKCDITLPEEAVGKRLTNILIRVKSADGSYGIQISGGGWTDIDEDEHFPGGWETFWGLSFGEELAYGTGTGIVLQDNVVTAYMVAFAGKSWNYNAGVTRQYQLSIDDYMTFEATAWDEDVKYVYELPKKTVTKQTIFENGNMYRLSATLEEPAPQVTVANPFDGLTEAQW